MNKKAIPFLIIYIFLISVTSCVVDNIYLPNTKDKGRNFLSEHLKTNAIYEDYKGAYPTLFRVNFEVTKFDSLLKLKDFDIEIINYDSNKVYKPSIFYAYGKIDKFNKFNEYNSTTFSGLPNPIKNCFIENRPTNYYVDFSTIKIKPKKITLRFNLTFENFKGEIIQIKEEHNLILVKRYRSGLI